MRTRYSRKKKCWIAADPDYPAVRGFGVTEEAAVEDLEDKVDDYINHAVEDGTWLDWPREDRER